MSNLTPFDALSALHGSATSSLLTVEKQAELNNMYTVVRDALNERTAYQMTVENLEGGVNPPVYKVVETRTFFTSSPDENIRNSTPVAFHSVVTPVTTPMYSYTVLLSREEEEEGDEFFAHVLGANVNQATEHAKKQVQYENHTGEDDYHVLAIFPGHVYSLI